LQGPAGAVTRQGADVVLGDGGAQGAAEGGQLAAGGVAGAAGVALPEAAVIPV
jgi:hypothetical protein